MISTLVLIHDQGASITNRSGYMKIIVRKATCRDGASNPRLNSWGVGIAFDCDSSRSAQRLIIGYNYTTWWQSLLSAVDL